MSYHDIDEIKERILEIEDELDEIRASQEIENNEAYDDLCEELRSLEDAVSAIRGVEVIPEDEFDDYAQELAESVCSVSLNDWPHSCIDWGQAADELRSDYTYIEINGEGHYYQR